MKRLHIVVSLITEDNDFQMEQAAAAKEAALRLGVDVEVIYADNDSIEQSQQVLKFLQSDADAHPDGLSRSVAPLCRRSPKLPPPPGSPGWF